MGASKRALKKRPLLGDILVELGLVTREQINEAVTKSQQAGIRMGQFLADQGYISDADLARALAKQFELEYIDLRGVVPTAEALSHIPHAVAAQALAMPIKLEQNVLTVVVADPSNLPEMSRIESLVPMKMALVVTQEASLRHAIEIAYLNVTFAGKATGIADGKAGLKGPRQRSLQAAPQAPEGEVEALVNRILERSINHQASDIHLEPQETELHVRERIDGILENSMVLPLHLHSTLVSRMKILGGLDIAEKRVAQDGRFMHTVGNRSVDFRMSTLPTIRGEKVVIRILDKSNMKIGLSHLGLGDELAKKIRGMLAHPHGILLVSGPTGSGKTTTVYSMLSEINSVKKNIITIEDPVEYKFDVINQVQVNTKVGLTFSGVLRNVLRQDPDVIMVGEIRDQETAEIATRAALTGHLVISTIHTNDAITAIGRLIDMGVDPFLISSALLGIVAQRLVRKLCKHCQEVTHELRDEDSQLAAEIFNQTGRLIRAKGCKECFESGYSGREGIYEVLVVNRQIRQMINRSATAEEIKEAVEKTGFKTLRMDGVEKVKAGITTVDEVLRGTAGPDT